MFIVGPRARNRAKSSAKRAFTGKKGRFACAKMRQDLARSGKVGHEQARFGKAGHEQARSGKCGHEQARADAALSRARRNKS